MERLGSEAGHVCEVSCQGDNAKEAILPEPIDKTSYSIEYNLCSPQRYKEGIFRYLKHPWQVSHAMNGIEQNSVTKTENAFVK